MVSYEAGLVVLGAALFGAAVLPRVLSDKPLSFPMIYVAAGYLLFMAPFAPTPPDPVAEAEMTERLTELVVIIALMGAGLKLDRPFAPRSWESTWRLLGVTMLLTVGATVVLGIGVLGILLPTAVLLGAVVAPTDPVLASDVQASPPLEGSEEELAPEEQEGSIRFALTSEAGLNDGLAFPFTNLAIAMAAASAGSLVWLGEWALVDVGYKITVGVVGGYVVGQGFGRLLFGLPSTAQIAQIMAGAEALAGTLIAYGLTELAGGYGFIAVFVAALEMRHYEWEHDYHRDLHDFAVMVERLLMAAVLVLFGGAIAGGLLAPLGLRGALVGLALVFVVRPLAGIVGLVGFSTSWLERGVVAAFGIRGVGSFYYLSHALNEASFAEFELVVAAERLWAIVGFVVLTSIVVHGAAAGPVMDALDRWRSEQPEQVTPVNYSSDRKS